jgi:hypothetical protein
MPSSTQRLLAATTALCLALSFTTEAYAFGHGGHGGGGHGGGGHGGGGHFGGGHFGGGHFGGHFGGAHFGGHRYSGHYYGGHFAQAHHFGGHRHFGPGGFGHHFGVPGHRWGHGSGFAHAGWAGHNLYWRNQNDYGGWGWGGPVFWPAYYDDALYFALWPDDYYDPFFDYGPDALFAGLFWPGSYDGDDAYSGGYWSGNLYAAAPPMRHRHHARRHARDTETPANPTDACAAQATDLPALPVARITKAIQPSVDQTSLLNDLQSADAKAGDILRAACPHEAPLTPVARFAAVTQRLMATQQAIDLIRTPLARLYDSLGDTQKTKFDAILRGRHPRRGAVPDIAAACKAHAQHFTGLPAQQIADTLKPTSTQKPAFDALKAAAAEASATLVAACPNAAPQTVTERFDAIATRLKATIAAITMVEPKLKMFYATLSDEQKARFNLLAPPQTPDRS